MLSTAKLQCPKGMLIVAMFTPISLSGLLHAQSGEQLTPPVAMPLQSQTAMDQMQAARDIASARLAKFDNLDFNVFSNQDWQHLKESHAKDIKVYWPDGHVEQGLEQHIASLKKLFVFAPDTRIKYHPVRMGTGEWTSVVGIMQGTFTKPMTMPNGKVVQPTGNAFTLPMCTVGHWKNGTMDAEYLFWDNATYYKELGAQ
jgi:hypothetical protein